jgi:ankyrin repeat protein
MSKTHSRAGNTPLHCAAHFRRHSAMRIICSDLERANINVTNAQGLTPAHIACEKDDATMLKILASEHSCDLTIPCSDGSTPSLIACRNCSADCLRVLADRLGSKIEDGAEGTWSLSPVHLCCNSAESTTHAKGAECLEIMSRAGCDLDKLVPVHGFNAVRIACENGNLAALRVLHNAGCNLSNVSNTGEKVETF